MMEFSAEQMKTTKQVTSKKGGLRTMPFIIANEAFEKVASYGLLSFMILYLMTEYHMDSANGASILFLWSASSNFTPIIGAFLSDSYLGRFRVIAYGALFSLLGMAILWFTAIMPGARPPHCNPNTEKCEPPKSTQLALLLLSFILMSVGAGGIRPCSLAFGADQFSEVENTKKDRILQKFFSWYYASIGISIMLAVTVIVYIQDVAGWVVGLGVPVGLMFFSTTMFLFGSSLYIKVEAKKSLFTGFAQVIAAAWKNKHQYLPQENPDIAWYYHKDSKVVAPTDKLRCLNKACIIKKPEDLDSNGLALDPWRLCTITQVEELKSLIKVLPIWSTGIMVAVTISQTSFPVLQASTMDRHFISNFSIPPSSFSVFGILSMTVTVAAYDQIMVPLLSKFTKRRRGLSYKERMGIGVALTCVATAVSAVVERKRRNAAIRQGLSDNLLGVVNMSAMWLVPQYCIQGIAEAFNAIGQIEFYYSQFPKTMSSIAMSLLLVGMGVGNLVGSLIVTVVDRASKRGGNVSWVSTNLNKGHYDYYYWILTILCGINMFYYILCSRFSWSSEEEEGEEDMMNDQDMPKSKESAAAVSV